MLRNKWPVGDHGIRPAGAPDKCFYCASARGDQHRAGCVIRCRTVLVRTIVEHVIDVPEDWEVSTIEFTEGSSCSNNLIDGLRNLVERLEKSDLGQCACGMVTREYVREASADDEHGSQLFINSLET